MEFQSVSEIQLCFESTVSKTNQGCPCDTQTLQTPSLKSINSDLFHFTANCAICQSRAFDWCFHLISISLPKRQKPLRWCQSCRHMRCRCWSRLKSEWTLRFKVHQVFLKLCPVCFSDSKIHVCLIGLWLNDYITGKPIISWVEDPTHCVLLYISEG